MAGKAPVSRGSSSSSLPPELSLRRSHSAPSALYDSIFSPPMSSATVVSREASRALMTATPVAPEHANQVDIAQTAAQGRETSQEGKKPELPLLDRDRVASLFLNHKPETFSLSNSIYYGGQDVFLSPLPQSSNNVYKNQEGDDNGDFAHRGDWWQGSLYY